MLSEVLHVISRVRNPLALFLDRAGLANNPYVLRTREGILCELRPRESDRYIFFESLVQRLHLARGQRLSAGDTVIDIGANIGCFAMLAGHLVGPTGRVIAMEPERGNYQRLVDNLARNRLRNVVAIRAAVGSRRGTATLRLGEKASFSSILPRVDHRYLHASTQDVPLITVEQILDEQRMERCNLLKLDCEGAEYEILLKMPPEVAARVDQISLETHSVEGHEEGELATRLRQFGYHVLRDRGLMYGWRSGIDGRRP